MMITAKWTNENKAFTPPSPLPLPPIAAPPPPSHRRYRRCGQVKVQDRSPSFRMYPVFVKTAKEMNRSFRKFSWAGSDRKSV